MLKNIGNHWRLGQGGEPLERMLGEEFAAEESGYFTDELAACISHRLVIGGYTDRAGQGELTGEWIVFSKHEGQRFYLTLASHSEGDDAIHKRIQEWSRPEFPFLFEGRAPLRCRADCRRPTTPSCAAIALAMVM